MRRVLHFQTFDGVLHDTKEAAEIHLDKKYTEQMSRLASQLCHYTDGKHIRTMDWLNENLAKFKLPMAIKADMVLVNNEDDD